MPAARCAAWYDAPLERFRDASTNEVIGTLTQASVFPVETSQAAAWARQVELLRTACAEMTGHLFLEFEVPRLASRIDAVLISGAALVVIEFKVGDHEFAPAAREQVWDYALDLKNFHRGSHAAPVFPLLCATDAAAGDAAWSEPHADGVRPPRNAGAAGLAMAIGEACSLAAGPALDASWGAEAYQPTPTIVQAARALYARHSVEAISRSDAGAKNLGATSRAVECVIERCRRKQEKAIVLVTGVPGAGKTLVGLNIATQHRRSLEEDPAHAVFLSGNGPLVAVLREALTRDEHERVRRQGGTTRKGAIAQQVKPFIQNVHHFRDEGLRSESPPHEHVVLFDEAQRAWDRDKTARFMKARKGIEGFAQSEPEFLLDCMDRFSDWAVAVCLVGGGQEIHDGEAGIGTWIEAVRTRFPGWQVHLSPHLRDTEYGAGSALTALAGRAGVHWNEDLHLATSMRSFRAEHLSGFVKALLDLEREPARGLLDRLRGNYPIVVTRDLGCAKDWVRSHARGSERYGLVASSQAQRLKPHAVDVRVTIDPVHWFLDERDDTRSSFYLEDAATEFQVQGLELDWACVTWDADLRMSGDRWEHRSFVGSRWTHVRSAARRRYLVNAYRVLLTRARQGMAIFVPPGDRSDPTRLPEFYDATFDYLAALGLPRI